jgi:hypothetical protein
VIKRVAIKHAIEFIDAMHKKQHGQQDAHPP